ncbi:hypothetical protein ACWD3J_39315 [Streptomyces sp. NPDC002755]
MVEAAPTGLRRTMHSLAQTACALHDHTVANEAVVLTDVRRTGGANGLVAPPWVDSAAWQEVPK